jgi:hypothetical protein
MPRVFLPCRAIRFDLRPAAHFGDVTYLLETEEVNPFDPGGSFARTREALDRNAFNPDQDYLCLAGPTVCVTLVFALALQRYQRIRVLLFDGKYGTYQPRLVALSDLAPVGLEDVRVTTIPRRMATLEPPAAMGGQ